MIDSIIGFFIAACFLNFLFAGTASEVYRYKLRKFANNNSFSVFFTWMFLVFRRPMFYKYTDEIDFYQKKYITCRNIAAISIMVMVLLLLVDYLYFAQSNSTPVKSSFTEDKSESRVMSEEDTLHICDLTKEC